MCHPEKLILSCFYLALTTRFDHTNVHSRASWFALLRAAGCSATPVAEPLPRTAEPCLLVNPSVRLAQPTPRALCSRKWHASLAADRGCSYTLCCVRSVVAFRPLRLVHSHTALFWRTPLHGSWFCLTLACFIAGTPQASVATCLPGCSCPVAASGAAVNPLPLTSVHAFV